MEIRALTAGEVAVLKVQGTLDRLNASRLSQGIRAASQRGCRRIILNLCDVDGADSRGLGEVLFSCSRARGQGQRVYLAAAPPFLREFFQNCGGLPGGVLCDSLYDALRHADDS